MSIKVFISHGTKETDDKPFLLDLKKRLSEIKDNNEELFDIFVDEDELHVGDSWRVKLFNELSKCQAGIVLLNTRATVSEWVHTEASILRWREWMGENIILILIYLDDEAKSKVQKEAKWKPLCFTEIQFLGRGAVYSEGKLDDHGFNELLTSLKEVGVDNFQKTEYEKLQEGIQTALVQAFKDSGTRDDTIKKEVEALLKKGPERINGLIDDYSNIFENNPNPIGVALDLIAPWWIDPTSSCQITRLSANPEEKVAFTLSCLKVKYTPMMYIRHACCKGPKFVNGMAQISGMSGFQGSGKHIDQIMDQVHMALKGCLARFLINDLDAIEDETERLERTDQEINDWIAREKNRNNPVFVVIPHPISSNEDLANAIFNKYPEARLLLQTKTKEDARSISHGQPLEPLPDSREEERHYNKYCDAKRFFE